MTLFMLGYVLFVITAGIIIGLEIYSNNNKITFRQAFNIKLERIKIILCNYFNNKLL